MNRLKKSSELVNIYYVLIGFLLIIPPLILLTLQHGVVVVLVTLLPLLLLLLVGWQRRFEQRRESEVVDLRYGEEGWYLITTKGEGQMIVPDDDTLLHPLLVIVPYRFHGRSGGGAWLAGGWKNLAHARRLRVDLRWRQPLATANASILRE